MRQVKALFLFGLLLVAACFAAPQQAKADGNACSYSTLAYAQLINVPLCNGSGALVTSGGGGSTTFPYTGTSNGQTAQTASFLGVGGLYNTSAPTLTNGQFAPVQLDSSGRIIVNCGTGCGGGSVVTSGSTGQFLQGTAGSTIAGGTANVSYTQSIGPNAATPISTQGQISSYVVPMLDTVPVVSGAISTATTTQLIAGSTTANTYIWAIDAYSTGTNSASTVQLETGTGATCGGSTTVWNPVALTLPTTANATPVALFGPVAGGVAGLSLSNQPIVIPAAAGGAVNVCAATAGTTIAVKFETASIQRNN